MYLEIDSGRDRDARQLLDYLDREREQGRGLHNRYGEPMDQREIQRFIQRSEEYEYERQVIISPEFGEALSDDEMSLATRETMREFVEDRPTATYCYAIHRDTEHPHAQVALTGSKADLWTDQDDLNRTKERAKDRFRERELRRERERDRQHERDRSPEPEREREPDRGRDRER